MKKTPRGAAWVICLVAGAVACGGKRPPATVPAGHSLIALLPDPETHNVGLATVWTKTGSVALDAERKSVVASDRRLGTVTRLSDEDVDRFVNALARVLARS